METWARRGFPWIPSHLQSQKHSSAVSELWAVTPLGCDRREVRVQRATPCHVEPVLPKPGESMATSQGGAMEKRVLTL